MIERPIRRLWIPVVCALALLAVPACDSGNGEAQQRPDQAPEADAQETVDLSALGIDSGDMETAAVWVVEFSDFGCVYCAGFHEVTYPELHREFVETGDVAWKYVPVSFAGFPNGTEAGLTGKCAAALGEFGAMRDLLYERREEWLASGSPDELFASYADEVDLDGEAFAACYSGNEARERLEEANRTALQIGVTGTPTFIIQGFPVQGAPSLDDFREALRQMVERAREPADR